MSVTHCHIRFISTISAWTQPGCKNAANDPHAKEGGDDFIKGLPGWCSTKKAGAVFFWLVFGKLPSRIHRGGISLNHHFQFSGLPAWFSSSSTSAMARVRVLATLPSPILSKNQANWTTKSLCWNIPPDVGLRTMLLQSLRLVTTTDTLLRSRRQPSILRHSSQDQASTRTAPSPTPLPVVSLPQTLPPKTHVSAVLCNTLILTPLCEMPLLMEVLVHLLTLQAIRTVDISESLWRCEGQGTG
jgi:hypothetical protein